MRASVGDHILVHGLRVGDRERHGEVLEVLGEDPAPPLRVRWSDGHEAIYCPSADAVVLPPAPASDAPS